MYPHNTKNLVYFANKQKKGKSEEQESLSKEQQNQILKIVANQSLKEKTPSLDELESIIQNKLNSDEKNKDSQKTQETNTKGGSNSIIQYLIQQKYLTDKKNWLTNRGFFEIGNRILQDVMKDLNSSDFGLHETKLTGHGNVTIDSTRKFEHGDDLRLLSVSSSLLNSIKRISKNQRSISFPISLNPDDFEQYETLEDVKTAIVYCIDLSSTMKTLLGSNMSRIEAAKKALWSLYILNKKFFPTDSIFVVGFASMASEVNPFDIPFLKTYDVNDNFLHYTNYQAAFRLARKILNRTSAHNKRIVMITDGQPSACFVENEYQKNEIISEKPYSNFYTPDESILSKVKTERNMKLDSDPNRLVYLCYRYKKVDQKIDARTLIEAKKCLRDNIEIDTIVISEEVELLEYVQQLEKTLKGKTYHIQNENMEKVLVTDYLNNTRKVINSNQGW